MPTQTRTNLHNALLVLQHGVTNAGPTKFWPRLAVWLIMTGALRRDPVVTLPNGCPMRLDRTSISGAEVFTCNGQVDWGSEMLLRDLLAQDGDFLDIGAHDGYYSLLMHDCVRQVYAFEPDPRNLVHLRRNAAGVASLKVVPKAVSRESGRASFSLEPHNLHSRLAASDAAHTIVVDVTSLDDFAQAQQRLRVTGMKIDVEGFEAEVLRGGLNLISRDQPLILAEFGLHEGRPNDLAILQGLVAELGYHLFAYLQSPGWGGPRRRVFACLDGLAGDRFPPYIASRISDHPDRLSSRAGELYFKMLFLVPNRLESCFQGLASGPKSSSN